MNREAVQTRFTTSKPKSALLHVSRAQRADATADDTLGSRINLCWEHADASLGEPRRGPVERGLAGCGTEVVRLASIDGAARGPLRVDHHPAHRIFLHASPPGFHSELWLESPQRHRVHHDRHGAEAHSRARDDWVQNDPDSGQYAGSDRDERGVIEERPEQILADLLDRPAAQLDRSHDVPKIVLDQYDASRLHRHVGAAPEGDPHIALREGRCIVDAVPHHRDDLALFLKALDYVDFLGREDLCDHVVDADLARDGLGRPPVVPREHDDLDPHRLQRADRLHGMVLQCVCNRNHPGHLAVDRENHRGLASLFDRMQELLRGVDGNPGVRHERPVSKQDVAIPDRGPHSLARYRFEIFRILQGGALRCGGPDDRLAKRMLGTFLRGPREPQDFSLRNRADRDDIGDGWAALRPGPRLVEYHGRELLRLLDILTARDHDAVPRALT